MCYSIVLLLLFIMGKDVEEVAASLVREYLSRKGLKKTIACMDEELPRTNSSINNRSDLRKILHLESLYKQNKAEEHPLKSMLEIIVRERMNEGIKARGRHHGDSQAHPSVMSRSSFDVTDTVRRNDIHIESQHCDRPRPSEGSSASPVTLTSQAPFAHTPKVSKTLNSCAVLPEHEESIFSLSSSQDNLLTVTKEGFPSEKKIPETESQKNRISRMRRGIMAGPIASSSQESNRRRPARKASASSSCITSTTEDCNQGANWTNGITYIKSNQSASLEKASSMFSHLHTGIMDSDDPETMPSVKLQHRIKNSAPSPKVDGLHVLEMVLDDIENEEIVCNVSRKSLPQLTLDRIPMDQVTATALKEIIFGSPMACFTEEWKQQNFAFSETPGMEYGIVQKKGGPCGVLAAVQACVLQKLLFEEPSSDSLEERLHVSNILRSKCLSLALADILWRAGNKMRATVAINTGRRLFTPAGRYKSDGILEMLTCVTVETLDDLTLLLEQNVRQFESGPFGCILLTVSVILSRTVETVRSDMDVPTSTLIGAHGYCTQELVNLLLCGQAVSNVFDDEMKLDSGNGNFTLLKGIKMRSNIGLLSLFEHYNICKVGSHLKTPRFPIWVVCSESHFSVLFSLCEDLASDHCKKKEFDLYYYDGLANQHEPIRLTVYPDSGSVSSQNVNTDDDLIPPLELCIRTKWWKAVVSWNDTEPIL